MTVQEGVVEERPQQATCRTSNRQNAGESSPRATASMDEEESAEEEAAATLRDSEEEGKEDEWSESSRYVKTR